MTSPFPNWYVCRQNSHDTCVAVIKLQALQVGLPEDVGTLRAASFRSQRRVQHPVFWRCSGILHQNCPYVCSACKSFSEV